MKKSKKSLVLNAETIRALQDAEIPRVGGAGDPPPPESWFLTVCAPCKTFPCGGGGKLQ